MILKNDNDDNFAEEIGAYGKKWGEVVYDEKLAAPTFKEIMDGIFQWYHGQLLNDLRNKTVQQQKHIINIHKQTFNELLKAADIPDHE